MMGCKLLEDSSTTGFLQYASDGQDFIISNTDALSWVAVDKNVAHISKQAWEVNLQELQYQKNWLEEECIAWLKRFLEYGKDTLERTESESILLTVKVISGPIILTIVLAGAGVLTWRRSREQEEVIYHPTKSAGTALPFRRAPTCPLSGVSAMHLTQWGLRELSICDKKTGATNFSLFFGSRKAVNFQALDGLLYHSRL
ncbi:LOW QUALITY PROTEIN: major histocompatibility complex class I-related gene protein [Cricetulus griseus]|uniref:LOW QUALITY PROTEIN: major histocompatibility complex class I-related gene protein n=1 Tax=Cricetulus griseus TaxID=10029 RepID=UPI0015C36038|nr:LOW QUALITY PROTEIN: major histocompatibility complex class I-related gene protein [Cricetulus griseus]